MVHGAISDLKHMAAAAIAATILKVVDHSLKQAAVIIMIDFVTPNLLTTIGLRELAEVASVGMSGPLQRFSASSGKQMTAYHGYI